MLIPPDNFGLVEAGVYRCSKLEAGNFPFLETLQLKSLVLLDAAKPPRTLKSFLQENNVDLYNIGGLKITNHQNTENRSRQSASSDISASTATDVQPLNPGDEIEVVLLRKERSKNDVWMLIEKNLIIAAFNILLDKSKHNVLLVDSSLSLVGILRKIQKWNFGSIINEYRIYTGNSSKDNYNVEIFLEVIKVELIAYDSRRKEERRTSGAFSLKPMAPARSSIDEGAITGEDDDSVSLNDFEDEIDDDVLSASPQIPANLLKLVEQRKSVESPSASPESRSGVLDRRNSGDGSQMFRRKSSVDSRYIFTNKSRLRNPSFSLSFSPGRRSLFESNMRQFKLEYSNQDELQKIKERYDYKYYKAALTDGTFKDVEMIRLHLPPEHMLPDWFIQGRNYWERTYGQSR